MLPLLLLPLLLSFHPASSRCCAGVMHEFSINVIDLGKSVQNCSVNCSSVHITDGTCKCLNLNKSREDCASPGYAIKALESLHERILHQDAIKHLNKSLNRWKTSCWKKMTLCSLPVDFSPKSLYKELELQAQLISSSR